MSAPLPDPLLAAWGRTLGRNRDRAAIFDAAGKILRTFAEIETHSNRFVVELGKTLPGEVVAIQIGNHPDWPSLFLACLRKQLVVVPLEQTISNEQKQNAFELCRVAISAQLSSHDVGPRCVTLNTALPGSRGCAQHGKPFNWQDRRPCLLKLTSGTTSAPRAVRFRSEQLLADCQSICETMSIREDDLNFGVIPISHSYGFSNLLTPLLVRGIPLALSSDRIPRAIMAGLAATGATVFPGMPVFYQSFCELTQTPSLPNLRLCISAGAPLVPETARAFTEQFGHEIHSFYGASECGGICYVRTPQPVIGFVGEPMCGVRIEPIDLEQSASMVRIRSLAVADGYFPGADEDRLSNGVFVPDDLLEKTPAGYRLVGRSSDLINVAGKKVHPAEVEAEILRYPGVRLAVVFGRESTRRNQEIVACIVANGLSERDLLAHCRARLSSWQVPRRIYFVETIPTNERGKISRQALAQRYRHIA